MAKGYSLERGFLFDYGWEKAMRSLSPQDFHRVFWALCDYQKSRGETSLPAVSEGTPGIVCSLIVPQINNRLNGSAGGSIGGMVPPTLPGTVLKIRQDKISQDKISQDKTDGADAPRPSVESVTEEEIITLFGQMCPSLIQPRGSTDALRDAMRQAAQKYSREEMEKLFRTAEATPFCRGETGSGRKFSLRGVLSHAEDILAGKYADYGHRGAQIGAVEDVPADFDEQWAKVNRYAGGMQT